LREKDIAKIRDGCDAFGQAVTTFPEVESLNFKYLIGTEFSSDFINRFSHEVQKIFGQHYAQTNQSPYLRLILASAEDIAEEPEAALKELNDWLVVLEKIQVESHENGVQQGFAQDWYRARVYATMHFISEEWIRRSTFVPSVLNDFNMSSVASAIAKFSTFPVYRDGFSAYVSESENITSDCSKVPTNSGNCTIQPSGKNGVGWLTAYSGYTYLTFVMVYTEKMIDSIDYLSE